MFMCMCMCMFMFMFMFMLMLMLMLMSCSMYAGRPWVVSGGVAIVWGGGSHLPRGEKKHGPFRLFGRLSFSFDHR